jgi:hypothetical protein
MTYNYIFNNENINIIDSQNKEVKYDIKNNIYIEKKLIETLLQNHPETYKEIAKKINDQTFTGFDDSKNNKFSNRLAILDNCIITKNCNIIIDKIIYRTTHQYQSHLYNETLETLNLNKNDLEKYEEIICLSGLWSSGIFHFPLEFFCGLNVFDSYDINKKNIVVHVEKKTNYIMQWLKLWDINDDQIIEGNAFGKKIYIPEFATSGTPELFHLGWLQNIVQNNIKQNNQNKIILIKRSKTRSITNFNIIERFTTKLAKKHNLILKIHDDINLPGIIEQFQYFSEAKIIIAPHGAGLVNLLSCKKNTIIIEIMDKDYINLCFTRIAYLLELKYYGILSKNYIVDMNDIINIMKNIHISS